MMTCFVSIGDTHFGIKSESHGHEAPAISFQVGRIITCLDDGWNMRPPHVWLVGLVAKAGRPNLTDNASSKEI
jgi:hypothetical protein